MSTDDDKWFKDPVDVAPYAYEWDEWLDPDETITSQTLDVAAGLTKVGDQISQDQRHVVFKVSGGTLSDTGQSTKVDTFNVITTSNNNVYGASKTITIRKRKAR